MNIPTPVRKILFAAIALAAPLMISGCKNDIVSPADSLAVARSVWAANGPVTYTMTIHLSCECSTGDVVLRVRKGVVESRRYISSGELVEPRYESLYPTVDGLFDFIQQHIEYDPSTIVARYDRDTGYPTRVEVPGTAQTDSYTVSVIPG